MRSLEESSLPRANDGPIGSALLAASGRVDVVGCQSTSYEFSADQKSPALVGETARTPTSTSR
jgi:hypothetical protein